MTLGPWQGGRRAARNLGAAGAVGLLVSLAGALAGDPTRVLYGYLVAYCYWLGIAVAALILLASFHAAHSTWPIVVRRFLESVSVTIPIFVVLFLPVAVGMRRLFPWVDASVLEGELARLVAHKRPYLNVPFFLLRAALYFALWIAVAHLLRAWSLRQDASGDVRLSAWQRRLGAGSIPFLALTMTFASFDWMMSVDPRFYSTIFGVYWFAGSFMCAFAVVVIAGALTRSDPEQFGSHMTAEHFHSLGKYLLSFVAFWGYMAFSQYMLIWIANIPEEVPWYIFRTGGGWRWVGSFLALFQFLVPFFLLLSRPLKRDPRTLSAIAAWLLLVHWIDLYWVVMPHLDAGGPRASLWDLGSFVGIGGVAAAFAVLRMRGVVAVPVRDPYLEESLRYSPP